MAVSVFLLVLWGTSFTAVWAEEVSWIGGVTSPAGWSIQPGCPTTYDAISFSGPTNVFSNACWGEVGMGGRPTLTVDNVNKTIELWFQPPPPEICTMLWNPVCGLQGEFGPLEPGQWVFFGTKLWRRWFSIDFEVGSGICPAFNPQPGDGETGVDPNTIVSWTTGRVTGSHDVYFGTGFDDVNDANESSDEYKGNQSLEANTYDPCGLDTGTDYYWRIDEVNGPNVTKGSIWSFTTWHSNPVGWWKFEGDANDSSGNGHHGTLMGDANIVSDVNRGLVLTLDGDADYVEVPDDSSLRFSQNDSFSISYWAMPVSGDCVVCKMRASNCSGGIFGYTTSWNASNSKFIFVAEKSCTGSVTVATGNNSAPAGSWYHVVSVYDNKDMKIYLNGQLRDTGTFSYDTGSTTPDQDLIIGARSYEAMDDFFNGRIDDVQIYDRMLSEEEIWELYQCGNIGVEYYVDANATGANDGSSWDNAYEYLQDALEAAVCGDEIRVAQGIYKPDANTAEPNGTGDRTATFGLISWVGLYGGYAGVNEPNPNVRDVELYETILSGDLDGNDGEISDPCELLNDPNRSENSYHVVTAYRTDNTAILSGVVITGGYADNLSEAYHGGGILNWGEYIEGVGCGYDGPRIEFCKVIGNYSLGEGGGMYNASTCQTQVIDCVFAKNASSWGGGGIKNNVSHPDISDCTFENNFAGDPCWSGGDGGAMDNEESSPSVTNCTFVGNRADYGGAIGNWMADCNPTFVNCIFSENSAEYGGVLWVSNNFGTSNPRLTNCTLADNSAVYGNALACTEGSFGVIPSDVNLTNCILWDGGDEIWNDDGSTITITYSDVEGSWAGLGNIDADPCFYDPCNGDYHLMSEGWRWNEVVAHGSHWKGDYLTSPCIDAGNPGSPLRDELLTIPDDPNHDWGVNVRINMGAFGGTDQASMPPYYWALLGDLTNDGIVDYEDLGWQMADWLTSASEQPGDLNRDGIVNIIDYAMLTEEWMETTDWFE